jgi:hypothetical protein
MSAGYVLVKPETEAPRALGRKPYVVKFTIAGKTFRTRFHTHRAGLSFQRRLPIGSDSELMLAPLPGGYISTKGVAASG